MLSSLLDAQDCILVSEHHKEIAIVDLCRPSDVNPAQFRAAAMQKQHSYCPVEQVLNDCTDQGWVIHVFPCQWVVATRCMIDPKRVESLLKVLGIQRTNKLASLL